MQDFKEKLRRDRNHERKCEDVMKGVVARLLGYWNMFNIYQCHLALKRLSSIRSVKIRKSWWPYIDSSSWRAFSKRDTACRRVSLSSIRVRYLSPTLITLSTTCYFRSYPHNLLKFWGVVPCFSSEPYSSLISSFWCISEFPHIYAEVALEFVALLESLLHLGFRAVWFRVVWFYEQVFRSRALLTLDAFLTTIRDCLH